MHEPKTAKRLTVPTAAEGARLDTFLAQHVPGVSRSRLHALIADGRVQVDGRSRKPAARIRAGQRITVELSALAQADTDSRAPSPEAIPLDVRYEDGDLLIVNKAAGLTVHPGPGHGSGTLVNAVVAYAPDVAGVGEATRPGIVHRLDKDTSGLLMVARNAQTLRALQAQVRARTATRMYLALVHGVITRDTGEIDAPIARHPRHRRKMAVVLGGRVAITRYRVIERFPQATLLEVTLATGRTHQIRVHLSHAGHPLVGDPVYGRRRERWGMRRQALHAVRLGLAHPRTGASLQVEAPPPQDFMDALARLRAARA